MTLEQMQAALEWSTKINLEIDYFWATAIMILIHAGFLRYDLGASRIKHVLASGAENILSLCLRDADLLIERALAQTAFTRSLMTMTRNDDPER